MKRPDAGGACLEKASERQPRCRKKQPLETATGCTEDFLNYLVSWTRLTKLFNVASVMNLSYTGFIAA